MAETLIARSAAASVDATTGMIAPQISQKVLAVDVPSAGIPLEMRSDGLLYLASGAAADSHARIFGWSTKRAKAGMSMTCYGVGTVFKYADETLTPGSVVYLGTNGTLSSTASVGDAAGCAQAIDASNIRITRNI